MSHASVYDLASEHDRAAAFGHAKAIVEDCLQSGGAKKIALIIGNGVNSQRQLGEDLTEVIKRKARKKRPPLGPLYGYEYFRRDKWAAKITKVAGRTKMSLAEERLLAWRYNERLRLESSRRMPRAGSRLPVLLGAPWFGKEHRHTQLRLVLGIDASKECRALWA